jgi:hypothetical protein
MGEARQPLEAARRDHHGRMTEALVIRLGEQAQSTSFRT